MTTHSSQHAQYIGRVGALAVALGIGVAVATGQGLGIAHADESSPSIDANAPEAHSGKELAAAQHQPVPKMKFKLSGRAVIVTRSEDVSESKVDVETPNSTSPTHLARTDSNPPVEVPGSGPTTAAGQSAREHRPQRLSHSVPTPKLSPVVSGGVESPPITVARQTERTIAPLRTFPTQPPSNAAEASAIDPIAVSVLRPTAVTPVHPRLALPTAILRVATDALAALASLVHSPPGTPVAPPPTLVALLGWVRREIQTAFDKAPVAKPDTYTTNEDTPLTINTADGVLGNDTDADADTITVASHTTPTKGALALNPDGSFSYTPTPNANGTDTFTYVTSDGTTTSAPTTVTITITPVNDPPVAVHDAATTAEDTPTTINVLANDTDADADTLSVAAVTQGAHGSVALSGNTVTYTPAANYNGTDTFSYVSFDGTTVSNVATVSITVTPVNDPPVAKPDTYTTNEDTPLTINTADGVLGNDTDADADTITVASHTTPTKGALALNPDGSFSYTPTPNANGTDTFTYVTSDGTTTSAPTTVTITITPVNDPPVAIHDAATTAEDTPTTINVLANDTDADADTLSVAAVTQGAHGSVALSGNTVTYTPAANYNGTDTFSYVSFDGTTVSNVATVSITVTPVNDPPVAKPDTYTTNEDTPLTINTADGVLGNDTDADADTITVASHTTPTKGALALNPDGSFSYTPTPNANGTDTFTYVTSDGTTTSAPTTVTITITPVNDPPVAIHDAATTAEDTPTTINVLANDTDADADTLSVAAVTQGAHGSVALSGNTVTYTPAANYNGTDTFSYVSFDGTTVSNVATVSITVTPVNDPPVAKPDTYTTNEDTPLTINTADGVLGNDTDADADTITVASHTTPTKGALALNPDGSFSYTPTPNANGTDTFTYVTSDGTTTSAPTTVTITITPLNHAPVANPDTYTTDEDVPLTIAADQGVLHNDTDADSDTLTVVNYTQPSQGTVALNTDGSFSYTPNPNANGPDTFTYIATDGTTTSAPTTVTITITPVNDPPVINGGRAIATRYSETGVGTGDLAATDADGDPLTYSLDAPGTYGSLLVGDDGHLTYTPDVGAQIDVLLQPRPSRTRPPLHPPTVIRDTFVITATDPSGATSSVQVTFRVQAYDGPEAEELRDLQDQQEDLSTGAQQDIDLISYLILANGGTVPGPAGIVAGLDPSDPYLPELTEWAARDAQIQTIRQQVIDGHAAD